MMHRIKHSKSLVESGGGILMIKNGLSVLKSQRGFVPSLGRRLVVSDHVGGGVSSFGFSSTPMGSSSSSRRFFITGGITTESSSSSSSSSLVVKRQDMLRTGSIPNLFRGRQTGGCVRSFVPHQCSKCHMLPYFARSLASSSASQSSGQTPRQEPEKKKKECQIKNSSELQRERCDETFSTEVSLNQFPGLLVHGNVADSKTRRLLRLNPDTGYFEEQGVSAAASNHHGHYELQVPNGHVCRGSAYGWLFLTDDNLDMKLLNPFSGAEIQLPPVKTLPNLEGRGLSKWFVSKAVFSANPSIEPRPLVLVIYGELRLKLAFCKPGDKRWTPLEFPEVDSFHQDAIYHKDQFYVLGYPGSIVAFDIGRCIEDDDYSVKSVIVVTSPKNKKVSIREWFFVVLDGEFFTFEFSKNCFRDCCFNVSNPYYSDGDTSDEDSYKYYVSRRMDCEVLDEDHSDGDTSDEDHSDGDTSSDEEDYSEGDTTDVDNNDEESEDRNKERWNRREMYSCIHMGLPLSTYGIKIRRFDASEKQWVKVESLGDKAVFLGYNTSFALSASDYPAGVCIPDSVYFSFGAGGTVWTEMRCYEVGIYNVKDKSIESLYPPKDDEVDEASQFKKPAPIWIVNNNVGCQ